MLENKKGQSMLCNIVIEIKQNKRELHYEAKKGILLGYGTTRQRLVLQPTPTNLPF